MSRHKSQEQIQARRVALWFLYAMDLEEIPQEREEIEDQMLDAYDTILEIDDQAPEYWEHIERRVVGVCEKLESLNEEIQSVSPRWRLERMATIDRNLLRLGAWEILYGETLPIIALNACIELAKEYGGRSSPAFVNGLLDQICKNHDISMTEQRR